MANKPSSKSKKSSKSVNSAVKGGGIMSLNKSQTSPFMKVVIILIIISMVTLFLYGGIAGIISLGELFKSQQAATTSTDPLTKLADQYQPQVDSFGQALASYPTSYTLMVDLADVHSSYAFDLMKLAQSSETTTTMSTLAAEWSLAFANYKKAAKIQKNLPKDVTVNYSIASFYSGDTTGAITIARTALKTDPNFAAAYYNLGIYYGSQKKSSLAIAAFQKYVVLDPAGDNGNPSYAVQQIKTLGGSVPSTASAPASATP